MGGAVGELALKELVEVRTLKENRYMLVDDEPSRITSITTSKPGKHGSAKARIEAVGLFSGNKRSVVYTVTDKVFVPMIDRKKVQILNIQGDQAQVMDSGTYETYELPVPEAMKGKLEPGTEIMILESMGRRIIL